MAKSSQAKVRYCRQFHGLSVHPNIDFDTVKVQKFLPHLAWVRYMSSLPWLRSTPDACQVMFSHDHQTVVGVFLPSVVYSLRCSIQCILVARQDLGRHLLWLVSSSFKALHSGSPTPKCLHLDNIALTMVVLVISKLCFALHYTRSYKVRQLPEKDFGEFVMIWVKDTFLNTFLIFLTSTRFWSAHFFWHFVTYTRFWSFWSKAHWCVIVKWSI